jgi:hypothetical protein
MSRTLAPQPKLSPESTSVVNTASSTKDIECGSTIPAESRDSNHGSHIPDRRHEPPKNSLVFLVLLSGAIFLYLQVFVLPATPRVASGDQAIYLHHAVRMLEGQMIYRDYDHFTLPGTDLVYTMLFKLFGVRAWIPQGMLIVLGVSMVYLLICISRKLMRGAAVYLPGLLFITLPFAGYLDATHHWYSTVATTAAVAILIEERSPARLVWAGVLLGVATFFTQSMVLLPIGLALFLLWERTRKGDSWGLLLQKEFSLLASFLATIASCLAYFVWKVGIKQLFYYTVVFVVKYYPADWFNTWRVYLTGRPQLHVWTGWLELPAFALIHLIVPAVYILFLSSYARKSRKESEELWNRLMLINFTGVFLFLTVASAPASTRLYAVSPPALVLLTWFLDSPHKVERSWLRLLFLTVFAAAIARPLVTQIGWKACLDLPTGRTAFFEPVLYEKTKWIAERTRPFDYFFGDQLMSFDLRLRNVGRIPFLRPTDYTRPEEVRDTIQALEKFKVRFVSWYSGLDHEKRAAQRPEGNHLAPIRTYLHQHYHIAHIFANGDQIWERD